MVNMISSYFETKKKSMVDRVSKILPVTQVLMRVLILLVILGVGKVSCDYFNAQSLEIYKQNHWYHEGRWYEK
jgi:hypothetical protein